MDRNINSPVFYAFFYFDTFSTRCRYRQVKAKGWFVVPRIREIDTDWFVLLSYSGVVINRKTNTLIN